jgi:hypothetical protein
MKQLFEAPSQRSQEKITGLARALRHSPSDEDRLSQSWGLISLTFIQFN